METWSNQNNGRFPNRPRFHLKYCNGLYEQDRGYKTFATSRVPRKFHQGKPRQEPLIVCARKTQSLFEYRR